MIYYRADRCFVLFIITRRESSRWELRTYSAPSIHTAEPQYSLVSPVCDVWDPLLLQYTAAGLDGETWTRSSC